jgi:tRNA U34 5-methylaminomethyl-2-thiouridine-forming methyltransferase MnmC
MSSDRLILHPTADGSTTFFSEQWQETFHSVQGAKQEAIAKFVLPSGILDKDQDCIQILDVCYGLGYNSAAAIECLSNQGMANQIEIIALELNLQVPQQAIASNLLNIWLPEVAEVLTNLVTQDKKQIQTQISGKDLNMQLLIGDARQTLAQVPIARADAIFLDPFSPPKCPQLWTVEFIQSLANCLKPDGYIVTYSCSAAIRTALLMAGLNIGITAPVGRRSPGTIAAFPPCSLPPLSIAEQELLQTRAAIPYSDRTLTASTETILVNRQAAQKLSNLESTSAWKKRSQSSWVN